MSYFGEIELARSSGLGEIVLAHHRSSSCLDPHRHDAAYLSICLDGSYFEHFEGGVEEVRCGDLFVHPSNEGHSNDMSRRGATILNFRISPPLQGVYAVSKKFGVRARKRCSPDTLVQLRDILAPRGARPVSYEFIAAAEILLPELGPEGGDVDEKLKNVVAQVTAAPHAPWTLGDLAAIAGYHRVYFAQKFKSELGCPPGEYIRRLRLRGALRLMCIDGQSATQAAHASGFFDSAHMANSFNKMIGCKPSSVRQHFSS